MRLTNLADYAVVVMSHAASQNARLSAQSVASATGLPLPTVAKVTGMLSKAGLIAAQRGSGGGFALSRPADAISIAEVIEAVDGPISLTLCAEHPTGEAQCARSGICAMHGHWYQINARVREALQGLSLADLQKPVLAAAE